MPPARHCAIVTPAPAIHSGLEKGPRVRSRLLHVFTLLMASLLTSLALPAHAEEPGPSTVVSMPDARFRSYLV